MNGQAFSWQDAEIRIRPTTGGAGKAYPCRAYTQKTTRDSSNIHVNSAQPFEYSRGPKQHEGSITVLQSTLIEMERDFPTAEDLTDLVFDVSISFVNPQNPDVLSVKVWESCSITEVSLEHGVDTEFMEVELPIRIGRVRTIV